MSRPFQIKDYISLSLLSVGIVLFLVVGHYFVREQNADANLRSELTLKIDDVSQFFESFYNEFYSESLSLSDSIKQAAGYVHPRKEMFKIIKSSPFDGISILKNDSLVTWKGYALKNAPIPSVVQLDTPLVSISREGNSTYLCFQSSFRFSDTFGESGDIITMVTSILLTQESFISLLGSEKDYINRKIISDTSLPIEIDFLGSDSENASYKSPLSLSESDTVGFAYLDQSQFPSYSRLRLAQSKAFLSFCLLLFTLILFIGGKVFELHPYSLVLILLSIFVLNLFNVFSLPSNWALNLADDTKSFTSLWQLFIYSIVLFLLGHQIGKIQKNTYLPISIGILTSVLFVPAFVILLKTVTTTASFDLLSLELIPSQFTILFYVISATALYSFIYLIGKSIIVHLPISLSREFITRPRAFIAFSILVSLSVHTVIHFFEMSQVEQQTQANKEEFLRASSESDQNIIQSLIVSASEVLGDISEDEVNNRSFLVQQKLNDRIALIVKSEWLDYSFDLRVIDTTGNELASYSSDLDTPSWTQVFDMNSLVIPYEQEQIRRSVNRPIIRSRPFNDLPIKYSSFKRAWIPMYVQDPESETIIAWVLCTLYKEPAKFDKPLRSIIMDAKSENQNQESVLISLYENDLLIRSRFFGLPNQLSHEDVLPELISGLSDSANVSTSINGDTQEDLYLKTGDSQVLRISSIKAGPGNHLYAVTRFFFVIFLTGFMISVISSISGFKDLSMFGFTKRFQYRLLDRVVYAILICLASLITITSVAVKNQHRDLIVADLKDQLENLSDALLLESQLSDERPSLERATYTLDIDASLFNNGLLTESTAPQIYEQQLLPDLIPYDVYEQLIGNEITEAIDEFQIGGQPLLIGYRKIPAKDQIIAIPTFISSPKYSEMLLSTNSYLLGLYVIIFGVFMIASALIARNLTRPVEQIKKALLNTGDGEFDIKLPVEHQDEIGSLSAAYNEMMDRLKIARTELAKAEREGAWKEMAQQVAHEIKNPLTPMKLNLQHLERQLKSGESDPEQLKNNIESLTSNIIHQINALDKIATDFSTFAKPSEYPFGKIEVNELLNEVYELYKSYDNKRISFNNLNKPLHVFGAKDELRAALINLVKNAIEATEGNGEIILELNSSDSQVIISVIDDGIGIAEEEISQIFTPRFSTKTSGTGLGLAITKKIIESHNGVISVKSSTNKGTTFEIVIPRLK